MVILHAQHVVGAAFTNGLRNAGLGAHSVDGDDTALKRQRRQQFGNRRDLTGLLGRGDLTEHEADVGGEGADQMQRTCRAALVVLLRLVLPSMATTASSPRTGIHCPTQRRTQLRTRAD